MTRVFPTPGARLHEEFLAVHAIMRRCGVLVGDGFDRLSAGEPADRRTLVETAHWLVAFTHNHHRCEDEIFWPVLRTRHPGLRAVLDRLTGEHEHLDKELNRLTSAARWLSDTSEGDSPVGSTDAARAGASAAHGVREVLGAHLDAEEEIVRDLFHDLPPDEVDRLRVAFTQGGPTGGTHLLLGLLEDPTPARGGRLLLENLPPPLRAARTELLVRYRDTRAALGLPPPPPVEPGPTDDSHPR